MKTKILKIVHKVIGAVLFIGGSILTGYGWHVLDKNDQL